MRNGSKDLLAEYRANSQSRRPDLSVSQQIVTRNVEPVTLANLKSSSILFKTSNTTLKNRNEEPVTGFDQNSAIQRIRKSSALDLKKTDEE